MAKKIKSPPRKPDYESIIEHIFAKNFKKGHVEFRFERAEISEAAIALGIEVPMNLGDVIYTYRYRKKLPQPIIDELPSGRHWLILGDGDARYRFRQSTLAYIEPTAGLMVRKIPDATPEIITRYAFNDEQALLAKIRYNRLIDTFLGITAYSLQNHLRTKIPDYGQIEIDELYVGIDARGAQYVVPVQAKGGTDILGVIQTIQDTIFCQNEERYTHSISRPVSAQFMSDDVIALFELHFDGNDVSIVQERHYKLTVSKEINDTDLSAYRKS